MRYQYVVILKKNSERATDLLSILLCFLSAIIFLFVQFGQAHPNFFRFIAAVILIGLALNAIGRRRGRRRISYRYLLFVAALGWIGLPFPPRVRIFFVLLAFLEYQTKRPLEIGFDQDRIVINTLIRQRHDWTVFNNIVLKD